VRKAEIDCDVIAEKEDVKDPKGNDLFGVRIPSKAEIAELGTRPSWHLLKGRHAVQLAASKSRIPSISRF
jgi:hypothetical protein